MLTTQLTSSPPSSVFVIRDGVREVIRMDMDGIVHFGESVEPKDAAALLLDDLTTKARLAVRVPVLLRALVEMLSAYPAECFCTPISGYAGPGFAYECANCMALNAISEATGVSRDAIDDTWIRKFRSVNRDL